MRPPSGAPTEPFSLAFTNSVQPPPEQCLKSGGAPLHRVEVCTLELPLDHAREPRNLRQKCGDMVGMAAGRCNFTDNAQQVKGSDHVRGDIVPQPAEAEFEEPREIDR